jgi:hypothetical protein
VHNECAWAGIKQILVNSNKIELFDKFHDAVHALNIGSSERKLLFTSISNLGDKAPKFILDFIDSPSKLSKFAKEAGLVEAWGVLSNGKASLRSIDNVNAVHAFRAANPNITDEVLQAAFESIKSSGTRRQAFVNALGSCADNKNLIGSLNKTKLALVDEIKDALNKMRDYRSGVSAGGNYGYIEGNIPGVTIDNKMWRSGSVLEGEPQIFEAIEVQGANGGSWLRNTDSEYKMLNDLADKLGGVKGQVKSDVTGTLKIVSENPYCTSCQGVIQQFSDMFPNIEIKLIDGVR